MPYNPGRSTFMTALASLSYLQDHAARNVWCNPFQDAQAIIKLHKITPFNGAVDTVKILWSRHALPDRTSYFHAYQVGQVHPELLGLLPQTNHQWVKVSDVMGAQNLVIELYNTMGRQMPRSDCYYKWTIEKNLVFIVKDVTQMGVILGSEPLFLRLYDNSFFHSSLVNPAQAVDYVYCLSITINNQTQHNNIIQAYNDAYAVRGVAVRAYVNGYLVKTLSPATCKIGDSAELMVDTSIREIRTYQVSDLLQFRSTRDGRYKYLIKAPVTGTTDAEIIYANDVDVYLIDGTEPIANKGVFYQQCQPDALRMVTHVDYSLPVDYLNVLNRLVNAKDGTDPLTLRFYIRYTGNTRRIVNEANRIKELYKLPFAQCGQALLGIDSTVTNWRADTLENSAYAKLMTVPFNDISIDLVTHAYGYNAISKLVGDNPVNPLDGTTGTYTVPYLMRQYSTAYEYDGSGLLIDSYIHNNDAYYTARNNATRLVEFMYGRGNLEGTYCVYGTDPVPLADLVAYRCYACSVNEFGNSLNNWTDVTGTGSYMVVNGVLTWSLNKQTQQGMVRFETGFLAYSVKLSIDHLGYLIHTLPGADPKAEMPLQYIAHAQYDYWLNGHALVEGIDYVQRKYNIVIFSKTYLNSDSTLGEVLTVRGAGFCTADLKRDELGDTGFIKYALLSYNRIFNIRDDKVMRVVVNGKLQQSSNYSFAETAQSFNGLAAMNGQPYQVKDMITPFTKLVNTDVYALRQASIATDAVVSNYLSVKMPEATPYNVTTTPQLYPLYSPFFAAIVTGYISGQFRPDLLTQEYGDAQVMQACAPFAWLLAYDPTQDNVRPDPEFSIVHPHAKAFIVEVPVAVFSLLTHIVRIYLHNRVNLSAFFSIAAI